MWPTTCPACLQPATGRQAALFRSTNRLVREGGGRELLAEPAYQESRPRPLFAAATQVRSRASSQQSTCPLPSHMALTNTQPDCRWRRWRAAAGRQAPQQRAAGAELRCGPYTRPALTAGRPAPDPLLCHRGLCLARPRVALCLRHHPRAPVHATAQHQRQRRPAASGAHWGPCTLLARQLVCPRGSGRNRVPAAAQPVLVAGAGGLGQPERHPDAEVRAAWHGVLGVGCVGGCRDLPRGRGRRHAACSLLQPASQPVSQSAS